MDFKLDIILSAGSNNPAPAKPSMSTQQVNGIMSDLKSFYQK